MRKLNYFRSFFLAATLAITSLGFTSCDDDNDGPTGAYAEEGVFVVNEGNFQTPNGSVSYYNTNTEEVQNNIFGRSNDNRPLGDVVQNMVIHGDRAFIVVNNSNKIEVVNAGTFASVGVVEGLALPRYFVALNNDKGYVTEYVNFGEGRVSVIDLNTYTVTKTIAVGKLPEQIALAGGKLYVANSGDNTVSVINTATDAVETSITVADAPNSLAIDRNNVLWVLSSGNKSYDPYPEVDEANSTAAGLTKINTSNNTVTGTITFPEVAASAGKLVMNGNRDKLYFIYNGGVHQLGITASAINSSPLINRSFYGLGVDPETSYIYGGDDNGFDGDGTVYIYNPDGTQISTFKAGIAPNGFVFN